MKKSIVYILFIVLITHSNCRKFKEDPFISLKTVKTRMKGEWKVRKLELNGEDVIHKYNDSIAPKNFNSVRVFISFDNETTQKKTSSYYECYNSIAMWTLDTVNGFHSTLYFQIDNKRMNIINEGSRIRRGKFAKIFLDQPVFEITKLYNNQLIIKNDLYEIEMFK
ncbi:MAG: hypothetical protein IM600_10280 [Bacteroidetes bacterium]|nr:hypothetical protein [Bacteroidota bacterium]MCA6443803.1 hypothetical protein [Bacteroidota bacterium]